MVMLSCIKKSKTSYRIADGLRDHSVDKTLACLSLFVAFVGRL